MSDKYTKAKYMTPLSASKNKKEALRHKADSLREKKSFKEAISTYLNSILIDRMLKHILDLVFVIKIWVK